MQQIPARLHPAPLFLYKFSPANILYNLKSTIDTFQWVPYCASSADLDDFKKQFQWDGKITVRLVPVEFARALAKICYSFSVAELGYSSFEALILDIILCKTENVSHLVGGKYLNPTSAIDDLELPEIGVGHRFNLLVQIDAQKRALLICEIRLFASISSPTYHVVVGLLNDTQLAMMFEKKSIEAVNYNPNYPF